MSHNPSLDGIRALAVISVIGYHWHISGFWGGFFGVDVFFVLSGYIITAILTEEIERTGKLAYSRFYWNRLLRLTPQLTIVVLACAIIEPFARPKIPLTDHLISAGLAEVYLSDYALAFWPRSSALAHTWSLAVEEHYYLLWPLCLTLITRANSIPVAACAYLAATAWRFCSLLLLTEGDWHATYARLDTRLSGLLLGGLLALLIRRGMAISERTAAGIGVSSLAILAVGVLTSDAEQSSLELRMSVIELASAGLIIAAVQRKNAIARLMRFRPLVLIGLISYGLYLWHFPILFGLYYRFEPVPRILITAALSLSLSAAIYIWIERPLRVLRNRPAKATHEIDDCHGRLAVDKEAGNSQPACRMHNPGIALVPNQIPAG